MEKKSIYEWMAEERISSYLQSQLLLKLAQEGKLYETVSEETSSTADDTTELRIVSDSEAAEPTETTQVYECTADEFSALKEAVMKACAIEVTPRQRAWITETIREMLKDNK